jgi:hypothetical protein
MILKEKPCGTFRVVTGVPKDMRPAFYGETYFQHPLGNPNEANRLKGAWLARRCSDIALARRPGDPIPPIGGTIRQPMLRS